jgi:DNA-binding response OmpR family regulator
MNSYNILIVEDESIPAHYLKKILTHSNHNVVAIANSKESALRYMVQGVTPDLILMDIKIRGDADGIELAKEIQSQYECAVLFISAYTDSGFLERAKAIDSIGYLVKPLQPDTLLSTIEIGMSQYHPKHELLTLCDGSVFNAVEQTIKRDRVIIDLSHHESILLDALLKDQHTLLSVEQLEMILCQDEVLGQGALRTAIWRLRKKLPSCMHIENVYNSGYKITLQ